MSAEAFGGKVVGEVYELHYRHTTRTYGGDVVRTSCMSHWTTHEEAEAAEKKAWEHHGWDKLEPKKCGTETWIEKHHIYSLSKPEEDGE